MSALFPDVMKEVAGIESQQRPSGRGGRPSLIRAIFGLASGEESPQRKRELGSTDPSGAVIEFLTFLLPSLGGLGLAVYGIVNSEPWYWYGTLLLIGGIVLTNALAVNGLRLYRMYAQGQIE